MSNANQPPMNDDSSSSVSIQDPAFIGAELRALRQRRGLSLTQVADGTKISKSFLSLVESGKSDIAMGRLLRLVSYFGISITDLLPQAASAGPVALTRNGEGRFIASASERIEDFLLAPDTKQSMLPLLAVFDTGGKNLEPAEHEGEEFVYLLDGSLLVRIAGHEPMELAPGDSVYFPSELPHTYENLGTGPARVLFVVSPPHF